MRQIEPRDPKVAINLLAGLNTIDLGASGQNLLNFEGETKAVIIELVNTNTTTKRTGGVAPVGTSMPTAHWQVQMAVSSYARIPVVLNASDQVLILIGSTDIKAYLVGEIGGDGFVAGGEGDGFGDDYCGGRDELPASDLGWGG